MSDANCCEHGDHPAPDGQRFCSKACERCEHESGSENGCDGICVAGAGHLRLFTALVERWRERARAETDEVGKALTELHARELENAVGIAERQG